MRSSRLTSSLVLPLVLLAAVPTIRAGDAWPVIRSASHEPNPFRYDRKLWQTVNKEFLEDAAACVLYAGNTYLVEPDGTIENITHEVTRLNSRKGIEKLGEYRHITYDPGYQSLVLNEAILHKADGRELSVDARHVQLRDVSTDYQVYDHEKQLIISFPNLEVGDTLEVKWTIRGKNPEHAGQFFARYDFGDPGYPVVLDELRVRLPASTQLKYACTSGQVEPEISEANGQRLYDWKARNTKQLPQDENLPPKEEMQPSVVCSTFSSWEEIGRWKQRLRADAWATTPEIRRIVADLTKGVQDPAAKARALTMWMRRNIRYVSSGEHHDYTPHPPARVFANRFGDCKDTSQLLAAMLREAGLKVSLTTLGTLDDGQILESVPSPWGTHAILVVTLADGEHWIDTTLSLGGWDYLPREDRNRVCYIVDPEGRVTLRRTPQQTADSSRYDQTTHVRIGADGSSRCERTVLTYGAAALAHRDSFVEVPAGERRRQVAAELQEGNNRARLVRLTFDEPALQDFDKPVTSHMVFEIPSHFVGSPDREGSVSDSRVWTRLLAYNLDYDRQVAFDLPAPFESRHRFILHLPAAYTLESLPHQRTIVSPWGRFEVHVKTPDGDGPLRELEITFLTRLENTRVEPARFGEYRRFQEEISKTYRVWLTLKPASDPVDIPVLEAVLALAPEDSVSAANLARIYSDANKLADARRVLRRARYYRPEDPTLWELSARCAADTDEEENVQSELARRFPEETRHQLALGALLIRRGKNDAARAILESLAADGNPADRGQAHFQLACSCDHAGKPTEALQHLKAAEEADPECVGSVKALLLRGHLCEDLGQMQEAAAAYRAAAYHQPNSPEHETTDALNGLVRLALAAKNRTDALDYLRRYALAVDDDHTGLLLAADYYLRLGLCDEAGDLATRAGRIRGDARVERILGLIHLQREEYSLALVHLEKAVPDAAVQAGTLRAMLAVGSVAGLQARLNGLQNVKDATEELRRACADARGVLARRARLERICPPPPGREAQWLRALDCLACAEHARACGRSTSAVEQLLAGAFVGTEGPGSTFALRARLELDCGKLAKAAADAGRAIALAPQEPGGYFVRGRVRLERGEAGAAEDLEKAAELGGRTDAVVLHALADALFRVGKTDQALALQREAVRLNPRDRDMAEQLAAFEKATHTAGAGG
jgi:tetratricopeptide (TPR) repeat protein/transglutaminase-like putative cysteine protease